MGRCALAPLVILLAPQAGLLLAFRQNSTDQQLAAAAPAAAATIATATATATASLQLQSKKIHPGSSANTEKSKDFTHLFLSISVPSRRQVAVEDRPLKPQIPVLSCLQRTNSRDSRRVHSWEWTNRGLRGSDDEPLPKFRFG